MTMTSWMRKASRAGIAGAAVALLLGIGGMTAAQAQYNIGRGPNFNVGPRLPNVNTGPGIRYAPGVTIEVQDDDPPQRQRRRERLANPPDDGGPPPSGKKRAAGGGLNSRFVPKELVVEFDGSPTDAAVDELARRFRLTRLESQSFPLNGTTLYRWRIPDGRSVRSVANAITASGLARANPNFRYALQQTAAQAAPTSVDAARYPALKLRLPEAHSLARGAEVVVAVIDSGIDPQHPEIAGAVLASYDALNSKEGPHEHGTGIAGAIVAHARLTGSAPSAQILAIRAFGVSGDSAESTSFTLLKSLDFAIANKAQIINMSFAGPEDPTLERALKAVSARGVLLIAAAGNAGPSSPPLYPGAYANVMAISATDSADRLFTASNRGKYVSLAAPGVDVLLPAPQGRYQVASGTSFSAAYVSGLAALMMSRNHGLTADMVRQRLMDTARDLGPKGRDDQYGAGLADAFAAVNAVGEGAPVSASSR